MEPSEQHPLLGRILELSNREALRHRLLCQPATKSSKSTCMIENRFLHIIRTSVEFVFPTCPPVRRSTEWKRWSPSLKRTSPAYRLPCLILIASRSPRSSTQAPPHTAGIATLAQQRAPCSFLTTKQESFCGTGRESQTNGAASNSI